MSTISTNLPSGFSPSDPTAVYVPPPGYGGGSPLSPPDGIGFTPFSGNAAPGQSGLYGGSSSGSTGLGMFSNVMNGFMNLLSSALGSLSTVFGGSSSTTGSQTTGSATAVPEALFTDATASSVGDPHDAFKATTAQGANVARSWDDMHGREDLLCSDSFSGGYRISTTSTAPQPNGVTYNASADVSTDGGATSVAMNANGSYTVSENGRNVSLARGVATALDGSETVTLGADGSLTLADANAAGGSLTTTLKSNGRGVDVTAHAANVDLGGYLTRGLIEPGPIPAGTTSQSSLSPFGTFTSQSGSGTNSFTDVDRLLQEEVAEL